MEDTTGLVGIGEAAKAVGVSRRTIERWVARGAVKAYRRKGDDWRMVRLSDVIDAAKIVPADAKEGEINAGDTGVS